MNEDVQALGNPVPLRILDQDIGAEVEQEGQAGVGDRVIFARYGETGMYQPGADHLLMDAVDLLPAEVS